MKTNITALMNLISEEEKNLNSKLCAIVGLSTNTTIEELDGRMNVIEDNKEEFKVSLRDIEKSISKLSKLKALLYQKNNSFKLTDGRTIQQAIVDNTNLRRIKNIYGQLLLSKNSKKRVTEVNNSYFECKSINYDINEIRQKLRLVEEKIQQTDFEISKLNSIEFEI